MSRSASSSPLRKKQRLSSPTYDAHFTELNSYDFQALDDIETSLSQGTASSLFSKKIQRETSEQRERRRRTIEEALKPAAVDPDDSGVVLDDFEYKGKTNTTTSSAQNSSPPPSHPLGFKSAASLSLVTDVPRGPDPPATANSTVATFLPVSMMISTDSLHTNAQFSSSPEETQEPNHDAWFAPIDIPPHVGFTFASTLGNATIGPATKGSLGFAAPGPGPTSSTRPQRRAVPSWASPSTAALEKAKAKLRAWDAEIEVELSTVENDQQAVSAINVDNKQPVMSREPFKGVENSMLATAAPETPPAMTSLTNNGPHSTTAPPRQFKAPAFTTPRPGGSLSTPSRPPRPPLANPMIARSSAALDIALSRPLASSSRSSPVTPVRPMSSTARLPPQTPKAPTSFTVPRPSGSQYQGDTPQRARPLGLTPRAHALTGSAARPKFVTPFKQGMKPGSLNRDALPKAPQSKISTHGQHEGKGKGREVVPSLAKGVDLRVKSNDKLIFQHPKQITRVTLVNSGIVPKFYNHDELREMGFDPGLFTLTTVSHFLYYRFNPSGLSPVPSTQMSLGPDSALQALRTMGCDLATKDWVDNHWSLVLWKMIGMACLQPSELEKRWCWDEVIRQLHYRYQRELAGGSRPALRLITTQDAPPSGPLVLCVSNIFWTDEYVDAEGRLVLAHPELELTDGWYRLRATVDEALARAARNNFLRVGRKIACSGAKLGSTKKDPMEVLDAYENAHLILSGNSTHLAQWHSKLGFQSAPFVATLRSLSSDGGAAPLMDLIVTQVFPVGFIEFITTENGEVIREGPRTEQDEALVEDRWKDRRSHEAAKLREVLEKKMHRLEAYADRLESIAGSGFRPTEDDSPPDSIDDLADKLEDGEDPASIIKGVGKENAGWLSLHLRKKCEIDREKGGDEIDRELATSFPPRQVRSFRVLRVKDARNVRKPGWRTAQLTVWDVMSLNVKEGGSPGSFSVGQRYMVSNLVPSQQGAWMGLEPGSEVYLSTRRDSRWKIIN